MNVRLFYCSVFFETVDYVLCLKELLWICFLLLSDVSGVSVESIWSQLCLEYGFCQVNWNLLQYKDYKNILLFNSLCVLTFSTFRWKVNCSPSWPYTFLFYFDICIKLTLPVTWCLNYIISQLFCDENILNMLHDKTISSKLRILK